VRKRPLTGRFAFRLGAGGMVHTWGEVLPRAVT